MPWWAWALVVVALMAGGLVSLVVLFLGLYTLSAPDCSAATAAGKAAHRVAGGATTVLLLGLWALVVAGLARARQPARRIAVAGLPLVLAPLLLLGVTAALNARMDTIGDDGGTSCF